VTWEPTAVLDTMFKPLNCRIVQRTIAVVLKLPRLLELTPILHRHMLGRRRAVFDMSKILLHLTQDRPITLRINNGKDKISSSQPRTFTAMALLIVRVPDVSTENQDGDNKTALSVLLARAEYWTPEPAVFHSFSATHYLHSRDQARSTITLRPISSPCTSF
jgi:hypothetical protein